MSLVKTVLFDLDGTLINTTDIILQTFVETFNHFMPDMKLEDEELTSFLGHTLFKTFRLYTDDEKLVADMVKYYREVSNIRIGEKLDAFPFAKETLMFLRKKKIQVGVVTSKMISVATHHLKLTGLYDFIDLLIGYEDSTNHKPHPEPLLKAIEKLNAKKEETIYIGDHENDIAAAKHAGILSCAVTYSLRLKEMLNNMPDFVIDELKNVKDLIE